MTPIKAKYQPMHESMRREYGPEKGDRVFYAYTRKHRIPYARERGR